MVNKYANPETVLGFAYRVSHSQQFSLRYAGQICFCAWL